MLGDLDKECVAMKHVVALATTAAFLVLPSVGIAFAGANPSGTGQPATQKCEDLTTPNPPGNTADSPGSPFADGGTAGDHYAGEDGNPNASNNSHAESQYDIACFRGP